MKLGIFGGTFDPIHIGHLILAEQCRDRFAIDKILFVPAGDPPHKQHRNITLGRIRLEMTELAISGNSAFRTSDFEIASEGPSYTVRTLEHFQKTIPENELYFIVGADSLLDVVNWYQPSRICELAQLVVGSRPGAPLPDLTAIRQTFGEKVTQSIQEHTTELPLVHISSSLIRQRITDGQSIRYLVPRAVECYIHEHHLYQSQDQ